MGKRIIEPKMIAFLDKKLEKNGLAELALANKDARTLMRLAAQSCVGIREVGGNNRGPMVSLIQDTVDGPDPWAWCMSFVQTCVAYAEVKTGVKSPLYSSEHCMSVWNETPKAQRVKIAPLAGAIAIWNYKGTQSGHTGILESRDNKVFYAYEGNTESGIAGGKVERDGGGVYYTQRSNKSVGKMILVGFLKPF